jgi:hypothetical protein
MFNKLDNVLIAVLTSAKAILMEQSFKRLFWATPQSVLTMAQYKFEKQLTGQTE